MRLTNPADSTPKIPLNPARFPRLRYHGLVDRGGSHLASQFGKCEAFPDDLRDGKIEAASIIKVFAVVVSEHLFIGVAEQVQRFYGNVRSLQPDSGLRKWIGAEIEKQKQKLASGNDPKYPTQA